MFLPEFVVYTMFKFCVKKLRAVEITFCSNFYEVSHV